MAQSNVASKPILKECSSPLPHQRLHPCPAGRYQVVPTRLYPWAETKNEAYWASRVPALYRMEGKWRLKGCSPDWSPLWSSPPIKQQVHKCRKAKRGWSLATMALEHAQNPYTAMMANERRDCFMTVARYPLSFKSRLFQLISNMRSIQARPSLITRSSSWISGNSYLRARYNFSKGIAFHVRTVVACTCIVGRCRNKCFCRWGQFHLVEDAWFSCHNEGGSCVFFGILQ